MGSAPKFDEVSELGSEPKCDSELKFDGSPQLDPKLDDVSQLASSLSSLPPYLTTLSEPASVKPLLEPQAFYSR
jgi:hypothetical protein